MSKKEHVWELGHGEVSIGFRPESKSIVMERTNRAFPVGTMLDPKKPETVNAIDESRAPVVIQFDTVAGLDVLLDRLTRLRANMVDPLAEEPADLPPPEFY